MLEKIEEQKKAFRVAVTFINQHFSIGWQSITEQMKCLLESCHCQLFVKKPFQKPYRSYFIAYHTAEQSIKVDVYQKTKKKSKRNERVEENDGKKNSKNKGG